MTASKKVLFVCYGSGHVRMVVPVAHAVRRAGLAEVCVLGLTTAATVVREAGLPLIQFKDYVRPGDVAALELGRRLMAQLGSIVDPEETAAYLGLSYAELVESEGAEQAERRYGREGRAAFLPARTLERILRAERPDLVVATNSPRAERAAIVAARALGIPAVCIVDLFAVDEVRWIGQPGYADRVCVLNDAVRDFLITAGRRPDEIVVTGNPAFEALNDSEVVRAGQQLRADRGWHDRRVVLWARQDEPAVHPFDGRTGDPALPARVQQALLDWTGSDPQAVLCVRPRLGEPAPALPADDRFVLTGQDWLLAPLLHAVDVVATLTSTVGLEGHLAGTQVLQVQGSVFDHAMPLARFGIANAAVPLADVPAALNLLSRLDRRPPVSGLPATRLISQVLSAFL